MSIHNMYTVDSWCLGSDVVPPHQAQHSRDWGVMIITSPGELRGTSTLPLRAHRWALSGRDGRGRDGAWKMLNEQQQWRAL